MDELDRIRVERSCERLINEYSRLVDFGEAASVADLFTEDATWEGTDLVLTGREEIRAWSVRTMTTFPGGTMTGFPLAWQVVDPEAGRLVCEVRNLMPDPGDGSLHEESNLTIMTYAGDGLFSREEDVYNPLRFARLAVRWARIAEAHGRLTDEGRAYLERYGAAGG